MTSRRTSSSRKQWVPHCVIITSHHPDKKYDAILLGKIISFGARGMSDYTIHKDSLRKHRYLERHKSHEDWSARGILSKGFWSRWLLWNQLTLAASAKDISKKFGIKVSLSSSLRKRRSL